MDSDSISVSDPQRTQAPSGRWGKPELRTSVPSSDIVLRDELLDHFNQLNRTIVSGLPEMARAYDVLHRHLPLLRKMQAILSQRPKHAVEGRNFTMLQRVAGKTIRMATQAGSRDQLPTWTQWIGAYATAISYSVRQIRRLVLGEARMKTLKECAWSRSDHNRLIAAATAGFDLVNAIEAGADTVALCREIKNTMRACEDVIDKQYEPRRVPRRKRPARRVTDEAA
jgi:hypothetical protein